MTCAGINFKAFLEDSRICAVILKVRPCYFLDNCFNFEMAVFFINLVVKYFSTFFSFVDVLTKRPCSKV